LVTGFTATEMGADPVGIFPLFESALTGCQLFQQKNTNSSDPHRNATDFRQFALPLLVALRLNKIELPIFPFINCSFSDTFAGLYSGFRQIRFVLTLSIAKINFENGHSSKDFSAILIFFSYNR
jgi:hypothetical protein